MTLLSRICGLLVQLCPSTIFLIVNYLELVYQSLSSSKDQKLQPYIHFKVHRLHFKSIVPFVNIHKTNVTVFVMSNHYINYFNWFYTLCNIKSNESSFLQQSKIVLVDMP